MANSLHASMVSYPIYIYAVNVDFSKFKTDITAFDVCINKSLHPPDVTKDKYKARKNLRQPFSPPIVFSSGDTFSLRIRYIDKSLCLEMKTEEITINPDDLFRVCSTKNRREYIKLHKKIRIIIDLSRDTRTKRAVEFVSSGKRLELRPDEIFRKCPRFRILLIGKTGTGRSSLLYHIFGVEEMFSSHYKPREASIDHELTSPQNDRLIIHDSRGFEPGEEDNLTIVRDFIDRRRNMSSEHQLHAIWLCFEIPRAGGRLLETGTEEFLKLATDGMLGNVPIIVVFTKYDMLIDRMDRNLDETSIDDLSDEAIEELVTTKAEAELQDTCIRPLQQIAGPDIPCATTSTKTDYEETLIRLIRMTEDRVHQDAAAVLNFITRQIDSEFGIKASIEVAKKRWKALALWTAFKNHELHTDIVKVWNFKDPHHYLCCQEFRELMIKIVEAGSRKGYRHYSFGHSVLRRFMSYTVHLTLVLQTLYLVSRNQELTRRAIKVALKSYIDSPMSEELFTCIQEYDGQLTIWDRMDRDSLDKIIEIMQFYDASELQQKIPYVDLFSDEPW